MSVKTVVGTVTAACEALPGSAYDGAYRYKLAHRTIATSEDACTPDGAATSVALRRKWAAPDRTTLLTVEEHSTVEQTIRLFHFRRGLPGLMMVTFGGDIFSAVQLGPHKFRIRVRGLGFGAYDPSSKSWNCEYEVDFAARSVESGLFGRHDHGVEKDACGTPKVEELRTR
ncbi:MAG TPA: hypothetical protein VGC56_06925 [Allosphingosinicella sp.]